MARTKGAKDKRKRSIRNKLLLGGAAAIGLGGLALGTRKLNKVKLETYPLDEQTKELIKDIRKTGGTKGKSRRDKSLIVETRRGLLRTTGIKGRDGIVSYPAPHVTSMSNDINALKYYGKDSNEVAYLKQMQKQQAKNVKYLVSKLKENNLYFSRYANGS